MSTYPVEVVGKVIVFRITVGKPLSVAIENARETMHRQFITPRDQHDLLKNRVTRDEANLRSLLTATGARNVTHNLTKGSVRFRVPMKDESYRSEVLFEETIARINAAIEAYIERFAPGAG